MFSPLEVFYVIFFVLSIYVGLGMLFRRISQLLNESSCGVFNKKFELECSDRIFGYVEDKIDDGIWTQSMISLWRDRKSKDFFILKTFENKKTPQKFSYVTCWAAKSIIEEFAPKDLIKGLISDWIDRNNRII